jgi:sRNA-binding protein
MESSPFWRRSSRRASSSRAGNDPSRFGITADIIRATEIAPANLEAALKQYVGETKYLERLRAGKDRVGLDGKPVGKVTEEHEKHSKMKLSMAVEMEFRRRSASGRRY